MKQRAFTLIEMLVVTGAMVVIFGLAFGIYTESEKASRNILHQQSGLQYCEAALDETMRALQGAVNPSELPTSLANQFQFKSGELTILTYAGAGKPAVRLLTIKNHAPGAGQSNELKLITQPLNAATGQVEQERQSDLVRIKPSHFAPAIHFAFAAAAEPGQAPVYADTWTTAALPKLIKITVEAALLDEDTTRSIKLQTAVIPGALPAAARAGAASPQALAAQPAVTAKPAVAAKPALAAKPAAKGAAQ